MPARKSPLFLLPMLPALFACASLARADEFEEASIHLEQNVVDQDAEAVINLKTEDGGLRWLLVIAPDGRRVVRYESHNILNLGAREILIETPEPSLGEVLAAYPEGTYRFVGRTFDGEVLLAEAELSHDFAEPATVTFPEDGAEVPADGLAIRWTAVEGAAAYFLELEQEDLELVLTVNLPAAATQFSPPAGWLIPGTEYVIGLGSITEEGNRTFVETTFTTSE